MSGRLRFLPRALTDLDAIWRYSADEWDETQADDYLRLLRAHAAKLLDHPRIGNDMSHLRTGVRRLGAGVHHLYYVIDDAGITVVRVLHQRMDVDVNFPNA